MLIYWHIKSQNAALVSVIFKQQTEGNLLYAGFSVALNGFHISSL